MAAADASVTSALQDFFLILRAFSRSDSQHMAGDICVAFGLAATSTREQYRHLWLENPPKKLLCRKGEQATRE